MAKKKESKPLAEWEKRLFQIEAIVVVGVLSLLAMGIYSHYHQTSQGPPAPPLSCPYHDPDTGETYLITCAMPEITYSTGVVEVGLNHWGRQFVQGWPSQPATSTTKAGVPDEVTVTYYFIDGKTYDTFVQTIKVQDGKRYVFLDLTDTSMSGTNQSATLAQSKWSPEEMDSYLFEEKYHLPHS